MLRQKPAVDFIYDRAWFDFQRCCFFCLSLQCLNYEFTVQNKTVKSPDVLDL